MAGAIGQAALSSWLAPRFPRDREPPNVMQPAPQTFAVWLPIFATSIVHAGYQALPGRASDPALRAAGWPAAVAYTATAAWAPLVVTQRYWSAQVMLFTIAASAELARGRLSAAQRDGELADATRIAVVPAVGMLAAWGTAASVVNLSSMLVDARVIAPGRAAEVAGAAFTLATAMGAATAAARAPGGSSTSAGRIYLATVVWALAGIVAGQRRRSPLVAAAAAAGLAPVGSVLVRGIRARRAGNSEEHADGRSPYRF